ncbi:hypothetical protein F4802DRAFT_533708 [Xylaria palmicola]|nr:hypothetical protein F4802DRAFT_533708 [Xylaria palmicola]
MDNSWVFPVPHSSASSFPDTSSSSLPSSSRPRAHICWLYNLPTELHWDICDLLDVTDTYHFAASSRTLWESLQFYLYRKEIKQHSHRAGPGRKALIDAICEIAGMRDLKFVAAMIRPCIGYTVDYLFLGEVLSSIGYCAACAAIIYSRGYDLSGHHQHIRPAKMIPHPEPPSADTNPRFQGLEWRRYQSWPQRQWGGFQ